MTVCIGCFQEQLLCCVCVCVCARARARACVYLLSRSLAMESIFMCACANDWLRDQSTQKPKQGDDGGGHGHLRTDHTSKKFCIVSKHVTRQITHTHTHTHIHTHMHVCEHAETDQCCITHTHTHTHAQRQLNVASPPPTHTHTHTHTHSSMLHPLP